MDRFWSKVKKTDDCWEWQAYCTKLGYGRFRLGDKSIEAHRLSYKMANGDIPKGAVIMHTCDNRKCVKPDHLKAGTQIENIADMNAKGRNGLSNKTHCPKGHPYSGSNLYVTKSGARSCKTCKKRQHKEWLLKNKNRNENGNT